MLCCGSPPPPRAPTHHTVRASSSQLCISCSYRTPSSLRSPLFFLILSLSLTFQLPPHPNTHADTYTHFLPLIKVAGALIKCSSPSRPPPPLGLGRALIPSPVLAALKSTARETGSFFYFSICIIPPLRWYMPIRVEDELICRAEYWHYNNLLQQHLILLHWYHQGSPALSPSRRHHHSNLLYHYS